MPKIGWVNGSITAVKKYSCGKISVTGEFDGKEEELEEYEKCRKYFDMNPQPTAPIASVEAEMREANEREDTAHSELKDALEGPSDETGERASGQNKAESTKTLIDIIDDNLPELTEAESLAFENNKRFRIINPYAGLASIKTINEDRSAKQPRIQKKNLGASAIVPARPGENENLVTTAFHFETKLNRMLHAQVETLNHLDDPNDIQMDMFF